jgi:RimJ/RimL family protein N-acetyltransferase
LLESDIAHWELHGFGPWLFRLREDDRPAARGGLWRTVVEGRPATEVQYAVVSSLRGQGLATEIARASVAAAFDQAGLEELVCFTLASNVASLRVMEKTGFQYSHDITRTGLPHKLYRLSKS